MPSLIISYFLKTNAIFFFLFSNGTSYDSRTDQRKDPPTVSNTLGVVWAKISSIPQVSWCMCCQSLMMRSGRLSVWVITLADWASTGCGRRSRLNSSLVKVEVSPLILRKVWKLSLRYKTRINFQPMKTQISEKAFYRIHTPTYSHRPSLSFLIPGKYPLRPSSATKFKLIQARCLIDVRAGCTLSDTFAVNVKISF